MSSVTDSIETLLKKTEHYDKDERYMATSDLCELLKRQSNRQDEGVLIGTSNEKSICTAVLRLLHDNSNDVQAIAVKTLSVLLTTVKKDQVLEIADSLADQVLDASKTDLRDVYTIGLRTLVKTVPTAMGDSVSHRMVSRLLDGVRHPHEEIVLACLDILTDLLARFGGSSVAVTRQHEPILQICLHQLSSEIHLVRKRAGATLACLSVVLGDTLLTRMVESLLHQIDRAEGVGKEGKRKTRSAHHEHSQTQATTASTTSSSTIGDTRALIRTMCSISSAVGQRLKQEHIDQIVPIFLRFTDPQDAITGDDSDIMDHQQEIDNEQEMALASELRESCFMGFESFISRCPNHVEPHLANIVQASLAYMSYDPNYSYGSMEDEGDGEEDDFEDEFDQDDEDDFDDEDEDESWKVRRSAVRALRAVVDAKSHDPTMLWTHDFTVRNNSKVKFAMALVERFKEREENCRVSVIDCFTQLVRVSVTASMSGSLTFCSQDSMDTSTADSINLSTEFLPKLIKHTENILGTKKGNERSKSSVLALLIALSSTPCGVGGPSEIASVFGHVKTFLSSDKDISIHREGTSKALRLEALRLAHSVMASGNHDPVVVRENLRSILLDELCAAVKEQWYKLVSEALRALALIPHFFSIGYRDPNTPQVVNEQSEVAESLFASIEPLLAATDVDQEIKECALKASAQLLKHLNTSIVAEKKIRLLQLLVDRMNNETTRIAAIKTIASVASEGEGEGTVDLSPILNESFSLLASFLKLHSRSTKQCTLEALAVIVRNHGGSSEISDGKLFSVLLQNLSSLITDSDLHISHLGLSLIVSILQKCPNVTVAIKDYILDPAVKLATSGLLQDHALESLQSFFGEVVSTGTVSFEDMHGLLRVQLNEKLSRRGLYNLALSLASVAVASEKSDREKVVIDSIGILNEDESMRDDDLVLLEKQFSFLVLGYFGRAVDLATIPGACEKMKSLYTKNIDSPFEDLKHSAAYSLGHAAVGSKSEFLPLMIERLGSGSKKEQYLVLSAVREFIHCSFKDESTGGIESSIQLILPSLREHCSDNEEGVRTMAAECLGALACVQPEYILKTLEEMQDSHFEISVVEGIVSDEDQTSRINSNVCWSVASAIKFAIAGKIEPSVLSPHFSKFVSLLDVEELRVRNAALLMVHSALHYMPSFLPKLLEERILPSLYKIIEIKMKRTVDLGPFKHTVDDALPLRKSALSIFSTVVDSLPGSLDMAFFMPVLAAALGDSEDIQLQAHQLVLTMCPKYQSFLVASIDSFVEPLEKTLKKKEGQKNATEIERLNDWIKSGVRVLLALSNIEGTMSSAKFVDLLTRARADEKKLKGMILEIEAEQGL